jgi:hypothetical protein
MTPTAPDDPIAIIADQLEADIIDEASKVAADQAERMKEVAR